MKSAVEGNFLPYPAMASDPLLAGLRGTPEFRAIRAQAIERQAKIALAWKARQSSKP